MNYIPPPSSPLIFTDEHPSTAATTPDTQIAPKHTAFQIGGDTAHQEGKVLLTSPIAFAPVPTHAAPKPKRKRNPWTPEEDDQLEAFIRSKDDPDEIPPGGYAQIAQRLNRTTKQCRERWHNYLRDGIQKGKWQPEEEELIRDLYQTFGSRWTAMAKVLKNRSANDIKNKWHAMRNKERRRTRHTMASSSTLEDGKPAARLHMAPPGAEDTYGLDL